MHSCVCAFVRSYVRVFVRSCVHACMRACVPPPFLHFFVNFPCFSMGISYSTQMDNALLTFLYRLDVFFSFLPCSSFRCLLVVWSVFKHLSTNESSYIFQFPMWPCYQIQLQPAVPLLILKYLYGEILMYTVWKHIFYSLFMENFKILAPAVRFSHGTEIW